MQPETKFKNKIRPALDELPNSFWVKIQMLSIMGIPDFIGCIRGRFVALELKKSEKVAKTKSAQSTLQGYILEKIRKAGGVAVIVYPENWLEIYGNLALMCLSKVEREELVKNAKNGVSTSSNHYPETHLD